MRSLVCPDFADAIDRREFLDFHLASLPPQTRAALIAWSEGKTHQQIAKEYQVSEAAVWKWIHQGIALIRKSAEVKK